MSHQASKLKMRQANKKPQTYYHTACLKSPPHLFLSGPIPTPNTMESSSNMVKEVNGLCLRFFFTPMLCLPLEPVHDLLVFQSPLPHKGYPDMEP